MSAFDSTALAALVFELLVKSLLLLTVALSAVWFMRRSSAAARHLLIAIVLVALVALPLASALLPSWHPEVVPERVGAVFAPAADDSPQRAPTGDSRSTEDRGPDGGINTSGAPSQSWQHWLFVVWLTGAAILLAALAAGKAYGYLEVRKAKPVTDEDFQAVLDDVARRLRLDKDVPVLESGQVKVPCVAGILRPKLLVPPQALFWPGDRLRTVLHHELSHVKRNDILAQFFAQVACCLYWPNPLVWIAERLLFIERERACDDMALTEDVKASDYAGHLMEVLEEMGNARKALWVTAAMAEGTDFKDRILSVLNPAAKRTSPRRGHVLSAAVVAALVVLPLSALRPWTTEAAGYSPGPTTTTVPGTYSDQDQRTSERERGDERVGTGQDYKNLPVHILIDQLSSPSATIRHRAAVALGESDDPRAVRPLIDVLNDEDAVVREHAATALGKLEDSRAVPKLCDLLLNDSSWVVREHAATALGCIGDGRAYQPLLHAVQNDSNMEVREHALSALRTMEGKR